MPRRTVLSFGHFPHRAVTAGSILHRFNTVDMCDVPQSEISQIGKVQSPDGCCRIAQCIRGTVAVRFGIRCGADADAVKNDTDYLSLSCH